MYDGVDGVVQIGGDLYVKNQQALVDLLSHLRTVGYKIDDLRRAAYVKSAGATPQSMEQNGWSLWYAHLDIRRGKCGTCNSYISTAGIRSHGHRCEVCGDITYEDIVDGSTVRFTFIEPDGQPSSSWDDIAMVAKNWDVEEGYLYLYPSIDLNERYRSREVRVFYENSDKWEEVVVDGERLIRVRYTLPFDYQLSAINPRQIGGHYWNHKIVLVWDGVEYSEYFSKLPIKQSMSIFETWHWAPLGSSPTLHRRVLGAVHNHDNKGWHYQDGRAWFSRESYRQMGLFIEHFTRLDAALWDARSARFPLDGPGGIDAVAQFCSLNPEVVDAPNIGNLIEGAYKLRRGVGMTPRELQAFVAAMEDGDTAELFRSITEDS